MRRSWLIVAVTLTGVGCAGFAAAAVITWAPPPLDVATPDALQLPAARAPAAAPSASSRPRPHGPTQLSAVTIAPQPVPLADLSDADILLRLRERPESLGTAIIGSPNRGQLINGVHVPERPFWKLVTPERSYVTPAVVASLERAVRTVRRSHANTPPLGIGDASREGGGWLRPHRSHQAGVDVDMGYYYRGGYAWYVKANADTLDRARTWSLVKAFLAGGNVEYIFIDKAVQGLLREHAEQQNEPAEYLDWVFGSQLKRGVVRHTWGHDDHIHVRFNDPEATKRGLRLYPIMKQAGMVR